MVDQDVWVERCAETDLGWRGVAPAIEHRNFAVNCEGKKLAFTHLQLDRKSVV